jgi:hypothetical protein
MNRRKLILDNNAALRIGDGPRRLDDGEVTFRIPDEDVPVLRRIYPELFHSDHTVRLNAWKKFRHNPVAEKYLVTRTPNQVKRSPRGIIVK